VLLWLARESIDELLHAQGDGWDDDFVRLNVGINGVRDRLACRIDRSGAEPRVECRGGRVHSRIEAAFSRLTVTPKQVTVGIAHACALGVDGSVWCAGNNLFGQLGDGTTTAVTEGDIGRADVLDARRVVGLPSAQHIALGRTHSCALADDRVFCWGAAPALPGEFIHAPKIRAIAHSSSWDPMLCVLDVERRVGCRAGTGSPFSVIPGLPPISDISDTGSSWDEHRHRWSDESIWARDAAGAVYELSWERRRWSTEPNALRVTDLTDAVALVPGVPCVKLADGEARCRIGERTFSTVPPGPTSPLVALGAGEEAIVCALRATGDVTCQGRVGSNFRIGSSPMGTATDRIDWHWTDVPAKYASGVAELSARTSCFRTHSGAIGRIAMACSGQAPVSQPVPLRCQLVARVSKPAALVRLVPGGGCLAERADGSAVQFDWAGNRLREMPGLRDVRRADGETSRLICGLFGDGSARCGDGERFDTILSRGPVVALESACAAPETGGLACLQKRGAVVDPLRFGSAAPVPITGLR
jgi:hypothetical protein